MTPTAGSSSSEGAVATPSAATDDTGDLVMPSDIELEVRARERLPDNLRDPRYPRPRWQQAIRWVLRWAWVGFGAYVLGAATTLGSSFINGQPITRDQVIQALLLGRVIPLLSHAPLAAALIPVTGLALVILAGWWAYRDRQHEQDVLNTQHEWVSAEQSKEHSRVFTTIETQRLRRAQQAEEHAQLAGEYVLTTVAQLNPKAYLASYVDVYQPRHDRETGRDADELARQTLRVACDASPAQDVQPGVHDEAPLGILVIGRPTLGKTRCAWEAMRSTLGDALFVRWPHGAVHPFDNVGQQGKAIVLWLDDLDTYATEPEAPRLLDLPRHLAASRLVVVATCRDGQEETAARQRLGSLMRRLHVIRLADLSAAETGQLAQTLESRGAKVDRAAADGTPGALLLGVDHMREERYPRLPANAQAALKAMKLLRSARIYVYSATRVMGVAQAVFGCLRETGEWQPVIAALIQADFVRLGRPDEEGRYAVEPVADVYLERAIPDYPIAGAALSDDWPALQQVFSAQADKDALFALGVVFVFHTRDAAALAVSEQALAIDPQFALAWISKGGALGNLGRLDEALAASNRALDLAARDPLLVNNPVFALAWVAKGATLSNLGRYDEALPAFDRALELDPLDAYGWNNKGFALAKLGRNDEAMAAFAHALDVCEQALTFDPQNAIAWFSKGNALMSLEHYDEALTAIEQALTIDPQFAGALYNKGYVLLMLERYAEALTAIDQVVTLDPQDAYAWDNKGSALAGLGRYDEALTAFTKAITCNPQLADVWNDKVALLKQLDRLTEAREVEQQRDVAIRPR